MELYNVIIKTDTWVVHTAWLKFCETKYVNLFRS